MERDSPTPGIQTLCLSNMGRLEGYRVENAPTQVSYTFTTEYLDLMTRVEQKKTKKKNLILTLNIKGFEKG